MIFSHLTNGWRGAEVSLDRALTPSWVIRRVEMRQVIDDERLLPATIGVGVATARARLTVVLEGQLTAWIGARVCELRAGEAFVIAPLSLVAVRGAALTVLELDWDNGARAISPTRFRLPGRTVTAAARVARALRSAGAERSTELACSFAELLDRFAADGLDLPARALPAIDRSNQILMNTVDAALAGLDRLPQSVDLEARLGCSRWTLTRRLHQLHSTYGICGVADGTDWRSVRDFGRIQMASIYMSHPDATTRSIAQYVGYGSPDAMCHAFAHAGLPSPARVRASVLAGLV